MAKGSEKSEQRFTENGTKGSVVSLSIGRENYFITQVMVCEEWKNSGMVLLGGFFCEGLLDYSQACAIWVHNVSVYSCAALVIDHSDTERKM